MGAAGSTGGSVSLPEGLCELGQRQVVHDRDVDEPLGITENRQDGRQVVWAAAGWDLWRRTLQETNSINCVELSEKEAVLFGSFVCDAARTER